MFTICDEGTSNQFSPEECHRKVVSCISNHGDSCPHDEEMIQKLAYLYGAEYSVNNEMQAAPIGDIVSVQTLLRLAGITLDANESLARYEGNAVMIDIQYRNWEEWTLPNSLPPVYIY